MFYQKPRYSFGTKPEYQKYRVKSPVKSFRDLEVYKTTTQLAVSIFQFQLPKENRNLEQETEILRNIAKLIPKAIAESYGDRFSDRGLAYRKLEQTMQLITNVITKIDFLIASMNNQEVKEELLTLLKKYQGQKMKILNLKRAWERVFKI